MKKTLISLIVVLTATVSFAQTQVSADNSVHLAFKGVPIDGTLAGYVSKMKQSGFTHLGTEDGTALLQGDFAAYKNCIVGVATLKQKDLVSKISVLFPECETWSALSSNYFSLKEMLTEKYGSPDSEYEEFQSLFADDDNSKMFEVKMDRCKYYTTYETEKGSIELSIHGDISNCCVLLAYFDKINGEAIKAEAMNDL